MNSILQMELEILQKMDFSTTQSIYISFCCCHCSFSFVSENGYDAKATCARLSILDKIANFHRQIFVIFIYSGNIAGDAQLLVATSWQQQQHQQLRMEQIIQFSPSTNWNKRDGIHCGKWTKLSSKVFSAFLRLLIVSFLLFFFFLFRQK